MRALKFKLSGKTALFKKPDVNEYAYFTYNHIHKVALLGILGAIMGLGGYNQQNRKINEMKSASKLKKNDFPDELVYPEFYAKLKDLKVSIVPNATNRAGYFTKKIQVFNNSVGYASKEQGGNLIVREQWLENPCWFIYILEDNSIEEELFKRLQDSLINQKATFIPYLGKNDHPAVIEDVEIINLTESRNNHINSIIFNENIKLGTETYNEEGVFFFKERVPCSLNPEYNFYEFRESVFTNLEILNPEELDDIYEENYVESGRNKSRLLSFL